jgi:hypothetical protein
MLIAKKRFGGDEKFPFGENEEDTTRNRTEI